MGKNKFSHVDRIAGKMRRGDSVTANYAITACISILQSKRAKGSREDSLAKIINPYIDSHPKAGLGDVVKFLRSQKGKGVIDSVTDTHIEWYSESDNEEKDTPINALNARILRRRKKSSTR